MFANYSVGEFLAIIVLDKGRRQPISVEFSLNEPLAFGPAAVMNDVDWKRTHRVIVVFRGDPLFFNVAIQRFIWSGLSFSRQSCLLSWRQKVWNMLYRCKLTIEPNARRVPRWPIN